MCSSKYETLSAFDHLDVSGNKPLLIKLNAPITTGIVDVFMLHVLPILISRSLYFDNFSTSFTEGVLPDGIVTDR